MSKSIAVLGAGMVGVCCALEMQQRGYQVTLIDRKEIACETSYGNAGVVARSSIVPINNPSLWKSLPSLIWNNKTPFRYDPLFMAQNLKWAAKFLLNTQQAKFQQTVSALNDLISLSITEHLKLSKMAKIEHKIRKNGWYYLYRKKSSFENAALAGEIFKKYDVLTQELTLAELQEMEPSLKPIFQKALWIKDGFSVDDPRGFVQSYASLFSKEGGTFLKDEIESISESKDQQVVKLDRHGEQTFDKLIVCLGPWAKKFLQRVGYDVTMAYERGYHMQYTTDKNVTLNRPYYDVDGGYVMAPMAQGIRMSTGVHLSDLDAPHQYGQLNRAEIAAREAMSIDERIEQTPWMGARPTLPDSRPIIGALPGQEKLWFAFGHQHIGLSTGPGTAKLIGALIAKEKPPIDVAPFSAERFLSQKS